MTMLSKVVSVKEQWEGSFEKSVKENVRFICFLQFFHQAFEKNFQQDEKNFSGFSQES